jgi:hypothetical protein
MAERFLGNYVLLSALMAITSLHDRAAIQAILLFSLRYMGHYKIFLKIGTKNTRLLSFSLLIKSSIFDGQYLIK